MKRIRCESFLPRFSSSPTAMNQVHQFTAQLHGYRSHISSMQSTAPENSPDPWEKTALEAIAKGEPEVVSLDQLEGTRYPPRFALPTDSWIGPSGVSVLENTVTVRTVIRTAEKADCCSRSFPNSAIPSPAP